MGKISPTGIFSGTYSTAFRWIHFFLPVALVAAFIAGSMNLHFMGDISGQGDPDLAMMDPASFWTGFAGMILVNTALFTLLLSIFGRVLEADRTWLKVGLSRGFVRLLPAVVGMIIYMVAILVGSVLLVIPGLMMMVLLYMILPLIVIDGVNPFSAIKDSWKMTWGNAWRLLGAMLLVFVPLILAYFLIGVSIGIISASMGSAPPIIDSWSSWQSWAWVALTGISWIVTIPFYLVAFDALKVAAAEGGEATA